MHPTQEPLLSDGIQMDTRLSDLLSPIRDPTKNWEVNIAATLEEYLSKLEGLHLTFHNGCLSLNFAQAALIIQGSTSVYCKKVEYLCSLCQQVLHIISSERRIQPQSNDVCKEKDTAFSSGTCDDFCSLDDLKIQKGLDLADDEYSSSTKRKLPLTPVMLIRLDEREKGHIMLLNSKGEIIGNKQDYHLNICDLEDSGALSFPMPFSESVVESAAPDFSVIPNDSDNGDDDFGSASVDDDVSRQKSCSPCPSNFDVHTEKNNISVPIVNDKLDVATEKDNLNTSKEKDNLNTSKEKDKSDGCVEKVPSKPQRKSLRHEALKAKRDAAGKQKVDSSKNSTQTSVITKAKKRKATKKLPMKLKEDVRKSTDSSEKTNPPQILHLDPVEGFCCQGFYSPKCKIPRVALKMPTVDILGNILWEENPKVSFLSQDKKGRSINQDTSDEIHENGDEGKLSDEDDNGCPFPGADDYDDDLPEVNKGDNENLLQPPCSSSEADKGECAEVPSSEELTHKSVESYLNSIAHYCRTDDLTKKVNEWEERIKPVLRLENRREAFDIHAYEGRVMRNFEENNRKQTVYFSKICEGKQKWEVCRYFLASLQLANSYDIDISVNDPGKGSDMELTLMSRKTNENRDVH